MATNYIKSFFVSCVFDVLKIDGLNIIIVKSTSQRRKKEKYDDGQYRYLINIPSLLMSNISWISADLKLSNVTNYR